MNSNILAFVPKIFFPRTIYLSNHFKEIIDSMAFKKTIVVISKNFKKAYSGQTFSLSTQKAIYTHSGEPTTDDLKYLDQNFKHKNFDSVVAIGGGSVIDLAKVIKKNWQVKLVVIPTTIGASSEVSQFALINEKGKKIVFHAEEFLPDCVIVDWELFTTLDKKTLTLQGIDALAHSIEALVSRLANPISDSLALLSLEEIYLALAQIAGSGKSKEVLEKLKIAALMAGLSQSSVGTGLMHAFAHYFGAKYEIPHAKAVSIFFLDCLKINLKNSSQYKKIDNLKTFSSKNILSKMSNLFDDLGVGKQKIKLKSSLGETANQVKAEVAILTNPFMPSVEQIAKIIENHS